MRERPILFSAPMVRALLAGRKTQTRRVVKTAAPPLAVDAGCLFTPRPTSNGLWYWLDSRDLLEASILGESFRCPYGMPGDRLWVKETWADVNLEGGPGIAYRANGDVHDLMEDETFLDERGAFDYDDARLNFGKAGLRFCVWSADLVSGVEGSWRSSIHMPRWASRLTLAITDVRVERLQEISATDAHAEGCDPVHMQPGGPQGDPSDGWLCYRAGFESLWASINGADSWAGNPWVWVVTFEVQA